MKLSFNKLETWLFIILILAMIGIGITRQLNGNKKSEASCSAEKSKCGGCAHKKECKTDN
ncbi:MAG: hypothetical protein JXR58_11225 [Bacteroidales bacterium]|nr:hypothetical protein [Bacteroidales bacterium]